MLTTSNQRQNFEHSKLLSYFFSGGFSEPNLPGAAREEHAIKLSGKPALMQISGQKKILGLLMFWVD